MVLFRSEFSRAIQKRDKKVDLTKNNVLVPTKPRITHVLLENVVLPVGIRSQFSRMTKSL